MSIHDDFPGVFPAPDCPGSPDSIGSTLIHGCWNTGRHYGLAYLRQAHSCPSAFLPPIKQVNKPGNTIRSRICSIKIHQQNEWSAWGMDQNNRVEMLVGAWGLKEEYRTGVRFLNGTLIDRSGVDRKRKGITIKLNP